MTTIKVKCVDQTLVFENTPLVASGGLQVDSVQFTFCSKWDGLEKTAVFWRKPDQAYTVMLDANDTCKIPPEVIEDPGVITFGVFGVNSDGKQRPSETLTYNIVQGAINTDAQPSDPTPDLYTQLLAQYAQIAAMYRSKADKVAGALAGNFAGLDAEGNLVDSGKGPASFTAMQIGGVEPVVGPVLWLDTAPLDIADAERVVFAMNDDPEGSEVSAEIDGEQHGVDNATVNTPPTEPGVYNFDIV